MKLKLYIVTLGLAFVFTIQVKAQNTGPHAPEAKAFEPVDASNMVELVTGDFSYVLPVLSIPGPEGDYSFPISYHAGVGMDQEASWIGLGWNLNVGAINRSINNVPDDWKQNYINTFVHMEGDRSTNYYYLGTVTTTEYSASVNYSWDNNKSNGSINISNLSYNNSSGLSIGIGSTTTYSNIDKSSVPSYHNLSEGIRYDRKYSEQYIETSSSSGEGYSNSTKDVYAVIEITWWMAFDGADNYSGTLHSKSAKKGSSLQDKSFSMDYELVTSDKNVIQNEESEESDCMLYPAYDQYSYSAEGLGGSMSPKIFECGLVFGSGKKKTLVGNSYTKIDYYNTTKNFNSLDKDYSDIYFYPDNEVSSYLSLSTGNFSGTGSSPDADNYTFDGGVLNDKITIDGVQMSNYLSDKKRLVKGTNIEWFKNSDLVTPSSTTYAKGFIETASLQNGRTDPNLDTDGIGAYTITSPDGTTYHYSLPVYQFEQIKRDESGYPNYLDFSEERRFSKYAYCWLLTAITGPDYIDRGADGNPNGIVDAYDWGYWVKFDYGNWTNGYIWQTPTDTWNQYSTTADNLRAKYHRAMEWGRKQIYYLNTITTPTHTAYFVKSIREDGLGATPSMVERGEQKLNNISNGVMYGLSEAGWYKKGNPSVKWPGFSSSFNGEEYYVNNTDIAATRHKVLKLDKIILVKNGDATLSTVNTIDLTSEKNSLAGNIKFAHEIRNISGGLPSGFTNGDCLVKEHSEYNSSNFYRYFQDNILDTKDVPSNFENKALKVVNFTYSPSYLLCPGTPNSTGEGQGKLTLTQVDLLGKAGIAVFPPYIFSYNNSGVYNRDRMDVWGYDKQMAENWSLKNILYPLGSNLEIKYEPDLFNKEAGSFYSEGLEITKVDFINTTSVPGEPDELKIYFKDVNNLDFIKVFPNDVNYIAIVAIFNENNSPLAAYFNKRLTDINLEDIVIKEIDNTSKTITLYFLDEGYGLKNCTLNAISGSSFVFPGNYKWDKPGGGLRVKQLILSESQTVAKTIFYDYIGDDGLSSGITSYSPSKTPKYVPFINLIPSPKVLYKNVTVSYDGNTDLGKTKYEFEVMDEWIPPYATGNLTCNRLDNNFYIGDQFKIKYDKGDSFDASDGCADENGKRYMYSKKLYSYNKVGNEYNGNVYSSNSTIHDNLMAIGRPTSVKQYNKMGQLISSKEYIYKSTDDIDQGKMQETFIYLKQVHDHHDTPSDYYDWIWRSSSKVSYPSVLEQVISTENGFKTTETINKYDFNTGQSLEVEKINPDLSTTKTTTIPAYTVYSQMGSKAIDPGNKNMLTQGAATITEKLIGTNWLPISTGIQTWSNEWSYREYDNGYIDKSKSEVPESEKVWRKEKSFAWKGDINADGTYKNFPSSSAPANIVTNWSDLFSGEGTNGWNKTSEITRYNHYSAPIEAKDINGKFAATRMGYGNARVLASATNASYSEFAHSSFESEEVFGTVVDFGSEIMGDTYNETRKKSDATITAHTGDYYLECTNGGGVTLSKVTTGSNRITKRRKYRVSVWMHENSINSSKLNISLQNGMVLSARYISKTDSRNKKFGNWILVSTDVNIDATTTNFSAYVSNDGDGSTYIDDMRMQPIDAAVSAYTYDDVGNVSAILNNDNFAVKYDYDAGGRLIATYKETPSGFKRVSENKYHYARSNYGPFDFTYSPLNPVVYAPITLTATGYAPGAKYQWIIGGAAIPSAPAAGYNTYQWTPSSAVGSVILNIIDADSKTTSISKVIEVTQLSIQSPIEGSMFYIGQSNIIQWSVVPGTYKVELLNLENYPTIPTPLLLGTTTSNSLSWTTPAGYKTTIPYAIRLTRLESNEVLESGWFSIVTP